MSKQEKLLAEKTVGLKPSGIRKFFDLVSEMEGAISLGVGEPDFDTPWHIRDEGIYSLEKGRTFYTSNAGLKELRQEIAARVVKLKEKGILVRHFPKERIKDRLRITIGSRDQMEKLIAAAKEILEENESF